MSQPGDRGSSLPVEPQTAEALLEWANSFPVHQLQRRLAQLMATRKRIDSEMAFIQHQLVRYREYMNDLRGPIPAVTEVRAYGGGEARALSPERAALRASRVLRDEFPPKRLAISRLLAEEPNRVWQLAEIREELTRRGWLEDTDNARHGLQVTILNMARRGEVTKRGTGLYQHGRVEERQELREPPAQGTGEA